MKRLLKSFIDWVADWLYQDEKIYVDTQTWLSTCTLEHTLHHTGHSSEIDQYQVGWYILSQAIDYVESNQN